MENKNEVPLSAVPQIAVKLEIALFANGSVGVNGPIHDKILSFGLLEMAKDAVREHHQNQQREHAKNIVIARPR